MNYPFGAIIGTKDERDQFSVIQLQYALRQLTDQNLAISGRMDEKTVQILRDFQRENGLRVTGRADLLTWNAVIAAGDAAIREKSDPLPLVFPPVLLFGGVLSPGDSGDAVSLIQILLNRFLLTLQDSEPLCVDGIFGASTEQAVRTFRRIHGLSDSGTVDKAVLNLLTASFSAPATYE